ncbi:hypothetical protein Gogos_011485 [Gossypium gossypioides]|uniref:Glycosyltransferase n=1 Tax=Gossypium gossypioides TaxID=34282 RepID=A0A7J9BPJ4_GOSGO|nr:hypothetical protein [Gossypium gossypioides]
MAELVFIPMPRMGHFASMVELARLLVDLHSELSITVLILKLNPDAQVAAYIHSLTATRIKFIHLPQPQTQKDISFSNHISNLQAHAPLVKDATNNILHHSSSRFIGMSKMFNIVELKDSDTEFTIPSYINPVSSKLFPTILLNPESNSMATTLVRWLRKAKGIMINTFWELESHAISSLSNGSVPPVYPVGPILDLERKSEVHQNSDIMKWLDEQPPSSVVFLCFGSGGNFNEDQVKEIASALEQSGHRFLWSLRQPPDPFKGPMASQTDYDDASEILPEGVLDRTHGIGKIIGWAPQVAILGHPAIGGFVSHCGWNSILESIWFGVPIATWPLYAEQQLNAFKLVTELGIAVEIKMDYRIEVIGNGEVEILRAETIEKGIRCMMDKGRDARKRVKEMSEKIRRALMDGGSSHSTIRDFINDVMGSMPKKN